MRIEELKTCEYSVFDGGRPTCDSPCGDPASYRVSWDGGQTWLHLCTKHMAAVEKSEQDAEARP